MKKILAAALLSTAFLFTPVGGASAAVPAGWINHEASVFQVRVEVPADKKYPKGRHGSGTAWYIGGGYFITCAHVVKDIPKVKLHNDKFNTLEVTVVWSKADLDVALLKYDGVTQYLADVPALKISNTIPGIGEDIEVVGYPGGQGPLHIFGKIASTPQKPDIDDEDDEELEHEVIAADMTTIAGESGGPVFNDKGEVIGIAEATWPVPPPPTTYLPPDIAAKVPHSPGVGPIGFIIPTEVYKDLLPSEFSIPKLGLTKNK